jgi:II/X family phage/plasmid replication protein
MIDWTTFFFPLDIDPGPESPLYNGEVMSLKPDYTVDWGVFRKKELRGSYEVDARVWAGVHEHRKGVFVDVNAVKWFQGHNIFGTSDLVGLVHETISKIVDLVGLKPSAAEIQAWKDGDIDLLRVDVTDSFDLGTRPRVMSAIRSLDATANLKFRGRGEFKGYSLLFGKGSRRWSLMFYAKGPELEVHKLPLLLQSTPLPSLADSLLRCEVRMQSMHLRSLGLHKLSAWSDNTASEVHDSHLAKLQISEVTMIEADGLEALSPRIRAAYQLWKDGHDLRAIFPRPTFYRYRTSLLAHGIDISVKQDRDASNVVPFRLILEARRVEVPDWAHNSPMYFEPRYASL